MKTFIRVVELWVPDRTRTRLEFGGCLCSEEYSEFKAVSENALFAYDEGLPGKAWASGHPVILTEFANSYFKRTDEAIEAGLTCGPGFAGQAFIIGEKGVFADGLEFRIFFAAKTAAELQARAGSVGHP